VQADHEPRAARGAVVDVGGGAQPFRGGQQPAGVAQQRAPDVGELDVAGIAAEMQLLGHRHEVPQLTQLHRVALHDRPSSADLPVSPHANSCGEAGVPPGCRQSSPGPGRSPSVPVATGRSA
jgi:hypothetical protein